MRATLLSWITPFVIAVLMLAACSNTASMFPAGTWKLISYGSISGPTPAVPNLEASLGYSRNKRSGTFCKPRLANGNHHHPDGSEVAV